MRVILWDLSCLSKFYNVECVVGVIMVREMFDINSVFLVLNNLVILLFRKFIRYLVVVLFC